jgi:hypothetical protein
MSVEVSAMTRAMGKLNHPETELQAKLLHFLFGELTRKEQRLCMRLELLHAQPEFREEVLHSWRRADDERERGVRSDAPWLDSVFIDDLVSAEKLATAIVEVAELHAASFRSVTQVPYRLERTPHAQGYVVRTYQYLGGRASLSFKMAPPAPLDLIARLSDDQKIALDLVLAGGIVASDADARFVALVPDDERRGYLKTLASLVLADEQQLAELQ